MTASDPDGQSDSTKIEVNILNVNDNYPEISAPDLVKISQGHDSTLPIASIEVRSNYFQNETLFPEKILLENN